ncbi:hypothetical protein BH09BAC2_BH09BAC2_08790 [soil metagenome]
MNFKNLLSAVLLTFSFILSGCAAKDSDIKESVDKKIRNEAGMSSINSDVKDGVVTLNGQAENEAVKGRVTTLTEGVKGVKSVNNNITIQQAQAPVQISDDTVLVQGVADATRDYPGVSGTVNNSVITLTGTISRDKLPRLMMALNGLNPRKIQNQLTIK